MRYTGLLTLLLTALITTPAYAVRNVSSPIVEKDLLRVDARFGYEHDSELESVNNRFQQRYFVDYGFTDWYASRVQLRAQKTENGDTEYTATQWQHRFQLFEKQRDGVDAGFIVSYLFSDVPVEDRLQLILTGQHDINRWMHRANIVLEREVGAGANDKTLLSFAWRGSTKITDDIRLGAEWFADLGPMGEISALKDQAHAAGPLIQVKFSDRYSADLGYLYGITDKATDGNVKLFLRSRF